MKLSLFFGPSQNALLIFLWKETHSETKSWKSSRIPTKKVQQQRYTLEMVEDFACEAKFLHFFIVHHFSSIFSFFILFFQFFCFFLAKFSSFFLIFQFFFIFPFFPFIFLFLFSGAQNLFFFLPHLLDEFLQQFFEQNINFFEPSRGVLL